MKGSGGDHDSETPYVLFTPSTSTTMTQSNVQNTSLLTIIESTTTSTMKPSAPPVSPSLQQSLLDVTSDDMIHDDANQMYYTPSSHNKRSKRKKISQSAFAAAQKVRNTNTWTAGGLFDCFSDMTTCLHGFFLAPCCIPVYQQKFNSSDPLMNCCSLDLCGIRYEVREQYHIEGNMFYDCMSTAFCWPCANAQVMREINERGSLSFQKQMRYDDSK